MQYKTIVLELLQQQPQMHDRLRESRTLLSTLERLAAELKDSHESWMSWVAQASPGSSEGQIKSEALEIALMELKDLLHSASSPDGESPLSLDGAMAFLRRHSPPA